MAFSAYFLSFFLSLWCASSPSLKLFKSAASTVVSSLDPNQHTRTTGEPSADSISFPGQEGNPECGPQTTSPTLSSGGEDEPAVEGDGERSESSEMAERERELAI